MRPLSYISSILLMLFQQGLFSQNSVQTDTYIMDQQPLSVDMNILATGFNALRIETAGLNVMVENVFIAEQNGSSPVWITRDSALFFSRKIPNTAWIQYHAEGIRIVLYPFHTVTKSFLMHLQIWTANEYPVDNAYRLRIFSYRYGQSERNEVFLTEKKFILKKF